MDTQLNIMDHCIGDGPMRDLYFALEGDRSVRKLVGWDAVDASNLSKYQKMLGDPMVDVFVINLAHPSKPMYFWNMNDWEPAQEYWKEFLPKEVRMALLVGAL